MLRGRSLLFQAYEKLADQFTNRNVFFFFTWIIV